MVKKFFDAFERVSLRARLTALSVALIGVLLVVSSLGTIAVLKTYLQQSQDSVLISAAQVLKAEDPALIQSRLEFRQLQLPNLPTDYFIGFNNPDGTLILGLSASTNSTTAPPNIISLDLPHVLLTNALPFEVTSKGKLTSDNDGAGWRIIAVPLTNSPGSVVIALPTAMNNGLIGRYRLIGLSFSALLLIFSGLAVWFTITRALRPLKEVERTAEAVAAGDISKRLLTHYGDTEIARVNRSLNTMLSSIETAMTARGKTLAQMQRFIADASHELRTPLVSVRGYAELYRMGALKDKKKLDDAMTRIESEAVRMTGLVESLLALARLEETVNLEKSQVNLAQVCADSAKDAAVAGNVKVRLTRLDGQDLGQDAVFAMVDLNAIKQVIINLLSNASRFTPAKSSIEIALGTEGKRVILEVRDHGEGIPAELRDKVFERFYRADNSRNRETGGNGLGLAIVRALVEGHDGTIKAIETPGGGATFRVSLPS